MLLTLFYVSVICSLIFEYYIFHSEKIYQFRHLTTLKKTDNIKIAIQYHLDKCRVAWRYSVLIKMSLLGVFFFEIPGLIEQYIMKYYQPSSFGSGILWALVLGGVCFFSNTAFRAYVVFVIEKRYGFSRYSVGRFLKDQIMGLAMNSLILMLVWVVFFKVYHLSDPLWLKAVVLFVIYTAFEFGLVCIYPNMILPLFNKYTKLGDPDLNERFFKLFERVKLNVEGVYVCDISKKTRHSNAYMTGFGSTKRLIVTDTLLSHIQDKYALEAIVAHEAGHAKLKHVLKSLLLGGVSSAGFFVIWMYFETSKALYGYVGMTEQHFVLSFVLPALFLSGFEFWFKPLLNHISRKFEEEADLFSMKYSRHLESLKKALQLLFEKNMSLPNYSTLFTIWFMGHPTLDKRLALIDKGLKEAP